MTVAREAAELRVKSSEYWLPGAVQAPPAACVLGKKQPASIYLPHKVGQVSVTEGRHCKGRGLPCYCLLQPSAVAFCFNCLLFLHKECSANPVLTNSSIKPPAAHGHSRIPSGPGSSRGARLGGGLPYLLFLLLKTDTARAGSMSLSLISSLCFPLFQKSRATSVILSAPALLPKQLQ